MKKINKIAFAGVERHGRFFTKSSVPFAGLVALAVLLVIVSNASGVRALFRQPARSVTSYADDINDRGQRLLREARVKGDFDFNQYGLALKPSGSVSIEYDFRKSKKQEVALQLWFYTPTQGTSVIDVMSGGETKFRLTNPNLRGVPVINLTTPLADCTSFTLRLSAIKDVGFPEIMESVFDRIALTIADPPNVPPIGSMTACVMIAVFVWWCGMSLGLRRGMVWAICAGLVLVLCWVAFWGERNNSVAVSITFWGSFVACVVMRFWGRGRGTPPPLVALVLAAAVYVGVAARWEMLVSVMGSPLEVDAMNYRDIAASMRHPFDTQYREPLFIWVVKLFAVLFHSGELSLRVCTFTLSVLTVLGLYVVGKQIFSPVVGLAAAFMCATNGSMIESSVRGLRGEAFMLTILALVFCMFRKPQEFRVRHAILLGVVAGLNTLNNLSFLSITLPLIVIIGLVRRWRVEMLALSLGISLLILSPHLVHNKGAFGDYFYTTNIHARYYRNYEFGGTPGFPSHEEIKRNSYAGKPISTFGYLFRLHSFGDVAVTSWMGFKNLYLTYYPQGYFFANSALAYAYIMGVIVLLVSVERIFLVGLLCAGYGMTFMAGRFVNFDWRLLMHVAPFMYLCAGYGLERAIKFASARCQPGAERPAHRSGAAKQKIAKGK